MDRSEDELLEAIRRVLSGTGPEVVVGPGDDAAVLAPPVGELVITTDVLVEGVHFERGLTSARDLGYKAVVVNLSDVAAMAGSPRAAVCALTISDEPDTAWIMELFGGMREACDEHALWLVGGDLSRGGITSIAVTVTGEVAPGHAVLRSGAKPGDRLVVTGSLGGSAAGLRASRNRRSWSEDERDAIRRHFRPSARVGEAKVLARLGATAMMDISDGLALDLSRLAGASGVGARLTLRDVPIHPAATLDDALGGGEDYELLGALPDGAVDLARTELADAFGTPLTEIGVVVEDELVAVEDDGSERPLDPLGWDHFA
ncbi:MAG TPA: thiamine-phosphate kinase [Actinomycetota bacterium]|nr:thiamine-phosphate kinase [Actinomycetota bacterium]